MIPNTITLDVRPEIRAGHEPFSKIITAAAALLANQQLLLIAPFEPVPLFAVMQKKGFTYSSSKDETGAWRVLFTRCEAINATAAPAEILPPSINRSSLQKVIEVDARGLEPPQPLVIILEAAVGLADDAELRARTDRRPIHLYPQLEQRGFSAETEWQTDGSFLTKIRHK